MIPQLKMTINPDLKQQEFQHQAANALSPETILRYILLKSENRGILKFDRKNWFCFWPFNPKKLKAMMINLTGEMRLVVPRPLDFPTRTYSTHHHSADTRDLPRCIMIPLKRRNRKRFKLR
jgi:hypothetical protein